MYGETNKRKRTALNYEDDESDDELERCRKRIRLLEKTTQISRNAFNRLEKENKSINEEISTLKCNHSQIAEGSAKLPPNALIEWSPAKTRKIFSEKFQATANDTRGYFVFDFPKGKIELKDIVDSLDRAFENLITIGLPDKVQRHDFIKISISNPNLDTDINIPFTQFADYDPSMVTAGIMRVDQSKKEFHLNGEVVVNVTHVRMASGGGNRNREIDFTKWKEKRDL